MQTSTTGTAVRCHGLTKRYGDLVAVDRGLSLTATVPPLKVVAAWVVASFLLGLAFCRGQ
jgi:hypothetical protein